MIYLPPGERQEGERNMKTAMLVAAGIAIGYFAYKYFTGHAGGKLNGRLHRSTADRKLAGVCGGIAEYLGIDPTVIRLVWALMVFGWGTGVLAYIVCALVLPEESAGETADR